eukprot:scaffold82322_cov66-Phaeocystis_antarctica.AAC.6
MYRTNVDESTVRPTPACVMTGVEYTEAPSLALQASWISSGHVGFCPSAGVSEALRAAMPAASSAPGVTRAKNRLSAWRWSTVASLWATESCPSVRRAESSIGPRVAPTTAHARPKLAVTGGEHHQRARQF